MLRASWWRELPDVAVVAGQPRGGAARPTPSVTRTDGDVDAEAGGAMRGCTLRVHGASRSFGQVRALREVSLDVAAGQLFVLLGPSGSGKTTLLRCIAGIERLDTGAIFLGDRQVALGPRGLPAERRELAMVFQDYALWSHLTAGRNLLYALARRRLTRGEAVLRCQKMLERVGLSHAAERYPSQLSGGEQQRVALARALVAEPRLVLMDEPLSHLDAELRDRLEIEIAALVRESGATCVYITHNQTEAFALADCLGVMQAGRLLQVGGPEEVYRRPVSRFVAEFTGVAGSLEVTLSGQGDPSAPDADGRMYFHATSSELSGTGVWCGPGAPGARGPALLMLRPDAVLLDAPGRPGSAPGAVRSSAYRGRGYEYEVYLADGVLLHGVPSAHRWPRGANVAVRVQGEGCLLFPLGGDFPGER